jgi:HD-like signal output (HDOD) protein
MDDYRYYLMLSTLEQVLPCPAASCELLYQYSQPEIDLASFADTISRYPAFARQFLQAANVPLFSDALASSVLEAVESLGPDRSLRLAWLIDIIDIFQSHGVPYSLSTESVAKHCIAGALLAEHISLAAPASDAWLSFLAAAMRHLSLPALAKYFPDQLRDSVDFSRKHEMPFDESVNICMAVSLDDIAALISSQWHLPAAVGLACSNKPGHNSLVNMTIQIVRIAESILSLRPYERWDTYSETPLNFGVRVGYNLTDQFLFSEADKAIALTEQLFAAISTK